MLPPTRFNNFGSLASLRPLVSRSSREAARSGTDSSVGQKLVLGNHKELVEVQRRVKKESGTLRSRLQRELVAQAKNVGVQAASRLLAGAVTYYAIRTALPEEQRNEFMKSLHSALTDSGVPGGRELVGGLLNLLSNHPIAVLGLTGIRSWSRLIDEMQGAFGRILETAVSTGDTKLAVHQRWQAQLNWLSRVVADKGVREVMPKEMYDELDRVMTTLRASVFNTNSSVHVNYDFVESDWDKVFTLLSLPLKTEDVYQHDSSGTPAAAREIDRKVDEVLARYDESTVARPLGRFMLSVREWFNTRHSNVPVAFLTSPPATGKTTAVMQLCEAIGATPVVVTMEDVADYLNESKPGVFQTSEKARSEKYGSLVTKIIETCNTRNYILFIDEADLVGQHAGQSNRLKKWLDPENSSHPKVPGFRFRPDLRAPVIIASNYGIADDALRTRMAAYIKFPSWTEAQFTALTREYFQAESDRRREEGKYDRNVVEAVLHQLAEVVDFIILQKQNFDVTIREVKIFIADMIRASIVTAAGGRDIDLDALKNDVTSRFAAIAAPLPQQTAGIDELVQTVTETRTEMIATIVSPVVHASSKSAVQSPQEPVLPAERAAQTSSMQMPPPLQESAGETSRPRRKRKAADPHHTTQKRRKAARS